MRFSTIDWTKGIRMLLLIGWLGGCTSKKWDPSSDLPLPDTVSFQGHIQPLFRANCSLSGCHAGPQPQGNLNLSDSVAYAQLRKRGMLDTAHPEQSVLYIQMNSVSNPMPPAGRLENRSVALVLKWIQQGAPNN